MAAVSAVIANLANNTEIINPTDQHRREHQFRNLGALAELDNIEEITINTLNVTTGGGNGVPDSRQGSDASKS